MKRGESLPPSRLMMAARLDEHYSPDIVHLRYFLDTRMKQKSSRNYLLATTPYRCSSYRTEKPAKTRQRVPKRPVEEETPKLPRLPVPCESLVGSAAARKPCPRDELCGNREFKVNAGTRTSNGILKTRGAACTRENWTANTSPRPPDNSSGSVVNLPSIHRTEVAAVGKSSTANKDCDAPWLDSLLKMFDNSAEAENVGEVSRVMDDGCRITATKRKLNLEIFLPRMRRENSSEEVPERR